METRRKRILVVEDDPDIQEITRMILEQMGHHEVIISCLNEVEHKLENEHPDLVLLDGGFHRKDFQKTCERIKRATETKHLPLLLYSTFSDLEKTAKFLGADDYLSKPFDVDSLLQKVDRLIRSGHT